MSEAKTVLMIASNPSTSTVTGWPVGFWWAELTHPFLTFAEAGYDITIASPDGGDLAGDGYSDPEDDSGYSAGDIISLGFKHSEDHMARIKDTARLADLSPDGFDAVMVIGGQGPMMTMVDDQRTGDFIAAAYEAGKVVCAICHGTVVLLKARLSDGSLLVDGKTWTGFANSEERYAEGAAGTKIQPFWIEDEAGKLDNTNFITAGPFVSFAHRDGRLVTGQQQNSGAAAARKVIEALGK